MSKIKKSKLMLWLKGGFTDMNNNNDDDKRNKANADKEYKASERVLDPVSLPQTINYKYPDKSVYPKLHKSKTSKTDKQSNENTKDKVKCHCCCCQ